jgi:phosphatidylinositol-3-phosphatase
MFTRVSALLALTITLLVGAATTASAQLQRSTSDGAPASPAVQLSGVQVSHVFIVMEENHSYSDVIGNPAMPYLNSLATTYSVAQGYYANTHPSIGNYFMLTTGQIITNDDNYTQTVTVDNVVRELLAAGKTWKEYSEALPYQGYDGGNMGEYAERHNPLSYMSDVRNDPTQQQNLVPFPQLALDIINHALPNYGFIVPDLLDDAHDGTLAQADTWLRVNIAPLLSSSDFNTPGGGLLIIVFDESESSDGEFGGGHVAWVAVGPNVNPGYPPAGSLNPVTLYQHQSTCRFMLKLAGVTTFPGAAATAPDMNEFLLGH